MKIRNKFGLAVLFASGLALNAHALLLTPSSPGWQGSTPKNPDADAIETITGTAAQLTQAYKDNVGGSEGGTLAGSYQTTYSNTSTDPQDAQIRYTGGAFITGTPIYLLVKDGSATPTWYVFNISSWSGKETITLDGFWPQQGAISHVSIYTGGGGTSVPDAGSTLALLGAALTGLGLIRRKLGAA